MESSGGKRVRFNTRERLVSDDANNEQRFVYAWLVDLLRHQLDSEQHVDTNPGYETLGTGAENPRRAWVVSGLRWQPLAGSASSVVSPGVAVFVDNPGATLDSIATLVEDPGVLTLGILTLTPGGGSTRIDVVECQPVQVEQSENRDQFNPATGQFTPVTMPKVRQAALAYRIRTGTAGAGFPGVAAGWVPLAVCSVPSAATTWDSVTCWDVRPLVSERYDGHNANVQEEARLDRQELYTDLGTPGQIRIYGESVGAFRQWKAGGRLGIAGYVDAFAASSRAGNFAGFPAAAYELWTIYAMYPFGLPRWVQYSFTVPRVPTGQRGIIAVSTTVPDYDGRPHAGITAPTSYGLVGSATQDAVALVTAKCNASGDPSGFTSARRITTPNNVRNLAGMATAGNYVEWTLTAGVDFPLTAKRLYLRINGAIDVTWTSGSLVVNALSDIELANAAAVGVLATRPHIGGQAYFLGGFGASVSPRISFSAVIPVFNTIYNPTIPLAMLLRWIANPSVVTGVGAVVVTSASTLQVHGWEV